MPCDSYCWPYVLLMIILYLVEWVSCRVSPRENQRPLEQENSSPPEITQRSTCSASLRPRTTIRRYFRSQRLSPEFERSSGTNDLIVTDSDIDTALLATSSLESLKEKIRSRNLSAPKSPPNIINNNDLEEKRSPPNIRRS